MKRTKKTANGFRDSQIVFSECQTHIRNVEVRIFRCE